MVNPRIWSGLEQVLANALEETISNCMELLAAGDGAGTEADRLRWRAQLNQARADLRDLTDRVEGR